MTEPRMHEAYIVGFARSPVVRAVNPEVRLNPKKRSQGKFRNLRPDELTAQVIKGLLARFPALSPELITDVMIGCATPEAEQGFNVARMIALKAGLPDSVGGVTINRLCASGAQAVTFAHAMISTFAWKTVIAGGVESMSLIHPGGKPFLVDPAQFEARPGTYDPMGVTAENVVRRFYKDYAVSREDQDKFAYESHMKAIAAIANGYFDDEIIPITLPNGEVVRVDDGPRSDTTLEGLARLRPEFQTDEYATVTAGNSSQVSDGASVLLLMRGDVMRALGLKPMGKILHHVNVGYAPEIMGVAPMISIPRVLEESGLTIDQIALFETNEAFACQCLVIEQAVGIPREKHNVNGGAIALGHALGSTKAMLIGKALRELIRRDEKLAVVSACVGGGQGSSVIIENCQFGEKTELYPIG
jgi:acetyl-CoA acyltransferase